MRLRMTIETVAGAIRGDQGRAISAGTTSLTRERASVKPIRDRFCSHSPNCAELKEQPPAGSDMAGGTFPFCFVQSLPASKMQMRECDDFGSGPQYGGAFRVIRAHQSFGSGKGGE